MQRTFLSTDRVVLVSAGELLRALPGVRCVDVDLAEGRVTVECDPDEAVLVEIQLVAADGGLLSAEV